MLWVYPVVLNVWLTPCEVSGLDAVDRVLGEEPRLGLLGEELDDTARTTQQSNLFISYYSQYIEFQSSFIEHHTVMFVMPTVMFVMP